MNNETCQCECKNYHACKKGYFWKPSTCICENNKYLISIVDTSLIKCDEIVSVVDIVSTKITNVVATNVSINSDDRKGDIKMIAIFCIVLLVIILLLIITIICYHFAKHRSNEKGNKALTT